MYTVAGPDPDPNLRGGGQLPNPNECNSTLASGTRGYLPPTLYIDVDERGYRLRVGSPLKNGVTTYVFSTHGGAIIWKRGERYLLYFKFIFGFLSSADDTWTYVQYSLGYSRT